MSFLEPQQGPLNQTEGVVPFPFKFPIVWGYQALLQDAFLGLKILQLLFLRTCRQLSAQSPHWGGLVQRVNSEAASPGVPRCRGELCSSVAGGGPLHLHLAGRAEQAVMPSRCRGA